MDGRRRPVELGRSTVTCSRIAEHGVDGDRRRRLGGTATQSFRVTVPEEDADVTGSQCAGAPGGPERRPGGGELRDGRGDGRESCVGGGGGRTTAALQAPTGYAAQRTERTPSALTLSDLDAPMVLDFLDHLETELYNTGARVSEITDAHAGRRANSA